MWEPLMEGSHKLVNCADEVEWTLFQTHYPSENRTQDLCIHDDDGGGGDDKSRRFFYFALWLRVLF
jgi:hypothetical protein